MKHETRTFTETIEYDSFEPGERVRLRPDKARTLRGGCDVIRVVTECRHPMFAGDVPIVFLEGHRYGLDARHFRPAGETSMDNDTLDLPGRTT